MYPYIKILNIYIPSYGLCVFLAVFICTILIFGKSYNLKIDHNDLMILIATSIGCGMFGGCLLYIAITDYNICQTLRGGGSWKAQRIPLSSPL